MSAKRKYNQREQSGSKQSNYRKKEKLNHVRATDINVNAGPSNSLVPYCSNAVIDRNEFSEVALNAWNMYFPSEQCIRDSCVTRRLQSIKEYLLKTSDLQIFDKEITKYFVVNVKHVISDRDMNIVWPEFLNDLKNNPKKVINYFGLAMYEIIYQRRMMEFLQLPQNSEIDKSEELISINNLPIIYAQFCEYDTMPLRNLKMNTFQKFVSVKGTVIRVGSLNTFCIKLAFQCNRCKNLQVIFQPNGNYTIPNCCTTKSCNGHIFTALRQSKLTKIIPWQNIRLQELIGDELCEKGRVPRTVECELLRNLVDRCVPGDIVTVSGIVKVIDPKEKSLGTTKNKSTYVLYILANHVECLKEKNSDSCEVMPGGLNLNMSDLYAVKEIHDKENLFNLVVASLCPNIYGHEIIKAGLVLSLFGGTQRYIDDDNKVPVRGDSHILIVGDPGLGKSQMLLACANVSPRGVYVCGNTSTSSGLTVTVTKEADGENGLDAGALVLADQGCCCIDEFDKMTNQHHALLEAMEQQTISIAKCGMSCILPARTSIIAASNPVGGHYNKAKTVSENIKLGSALLSRFDLVFIVIDKADTELDSKLSDYVIAMHNGRRKSDVCEKQRLVQNVSQQSDITDSCKLLDGKNNLSEHFKYKGNQKLIDVEYLRKYISYGRKYVHPKLSTEAAKILQNFYVDLRKQHQSPNSTPITNRQLESMIRLTEARARVELREVCTTEDAQIVVDIMKYSMADTYSDEFGNIDFQRLIHGSGVSKTAKVKKFLKYLSSLANRKASSYFTKSDLENTANDLGIDTSGFDEFLETLNYQGYLIKKGPKLYQLETL